MKHITVFLIAALLFTCHDVRADNQKLAQTGMVFLSLSLDARLSGMGRAAVAMEGASNSLLYNPAGMARLNNTVTASLGQMNWIADINYQYATLSYSPQGGRWGVFGLTYVAPDYGNLQGTVRSENIQGFLDTGEFTPVAYSLGLGYARALTDKFSIGGHMKYVYQNLTGGAVQVEQDEQIVTRQYELDVFAFDFGILYKTGFKSLNFGMYVRNFSQEVEYIAESFQLPLTFEIGLAMDVLDFTEMDRDRHSLVASFDASHPRDYPEQVDFGLEYTFMNQVALRTGYTNPTDIEGMSFGAGLRQGIGGINLSVDYAFTPLSVFKDTHRFSIGFSF